MTDKPGADPDVQPRPRGVAGLRTALVANLASTVWGALVGILAVPLYVRYLGIEAYGLIGFFTTLQTTLALLDLGLSSTLTREIARMRGTAASVDERSNLVRTLEVIYVTIALLLAVGLSALAGPLARDWVRAEHLPTETVERAFRHMAWAIAASWPASLYIGALLGLERQVIVSIVGTVFSTTKALGIILVFWFVRPTVDAFFVWQTVNVLVQVVVLSWAVWRTMPGRALRARFDRGVLARVWRFAAGIMVVDATGLVLSQIDKILLSKLLTLEAFGVFALVSTIAGNVSRIVGPIYTVYYPRLAAVVARGDDAEIERVYLDGAQVLALVVAPVCVVLALYPAEALVAWTGDAGIARAGAAVLSALIFGRLVNAVMHMPGALLLANGWTRITTYTNLLLIALVVPMVIVGVRAFGALGAALTWCFLTVVSLVVQVPIMHRRLLPGRMAAWLKLGVFLPVVGATLAAGAARVLIAAPTNRWTALAELAAVSAVTFLGCLLALPAPRRWLAGRLAKP